MSTSLLKMFIATSASVTVASALLLYKYQLKLIYPAGLNDARSPDAHHPTPEEYGIPYQDLYLETTDGVKLHAFLCLQDAEDSINYQKKTVLILNPNAGNIGLAVPTVANFYQLGYNVLIYDYRGYGLSSGEASEVGLKKDADAVLEYITNHQQLKKTSLILYGRSLGGAVAIYIASKNYTCVKGVILENTFLSIRKTIPHIFPFLKYAVKLCHQLWDSEKDILKIDPNVKMLFLNAELDEVVPPLHMKTLYELSSKTAEHRYKKFVTFEGAHHNDTTLCPGYWDLVGDFIETIDSKE